MHNKPKTTRVVAAKNNKFEEMSDLQIDDEKEDWYDKINDNVAPSPRSREKYKPAKVHCEDCNKTIEVNPMFARTPYRCDLIKCGKKCPNKG